MRYGIIGVGGYVARKHLDAIQATGGDVVVACDHHDTVGILDSYSPRCRFHLHEDEFFADLDDVDCLVVLTPNARHVHDALPALADSRHAIIEKPLGLTTRMVEQLLPHGDRVHPVMQLRDHPAVVEHIARPLHARGSRVEIRYTVHRGPWYQSSWKSRDAESGGIMANIGIHLFDLCIYLFGEVATWGVEKLAATNSIGWLEMACGTSVSWQLSTDAEVDRRVISIDRGRWRLDLSDIARLHLHRRVYERQLAGTSWRVADAMRAVRLVEALRGG